VFTIPFSDFPKCGRIHPTYMQTERCGWSFRGCAVYGSKVDIGDHHTERADGAVQQGNDQKADEQYERAFFLFYCLNSFFEKVI
jgi:hypothetical protein